MWLGVRGGDWAMWWLAGCLFTTSVHTYLFEQIVCFGQSNRKLSGWSLRPSSGPFGRCVTLDKSLSI